MRKTHFNKIAITFFGVLVLISALIVSLINAGSSSSQTTADCGGLNMTVSMPSGSPNNYVLSGEADVNITSLPTTPINQIFIFANETKIGQAQPSGTNTWLFRWATALWPTGGTASTVKISAKAVYSDHICSIATTVDHYYLMPQATSNLTLTASPFPWEGHVNSSIVFAANSSVEPASATTFDINPYTIYTWTAPTLGSIFNVTNTFLDKTRMNFSTGQVAGTTSIPVNVIYGGVTKSISIPITIKPAATTTTTTNTGSTGSTTTSTTTPTPTPTPVTSATTTDSTAAITATQVTSSQVQVSAITKSCVETELGAERYKAINSGESRPTADELAKISNCFATSKYILPSNFSPVDPVKVDALTVENTVAAIRNLENVTKTVGTTKTDTLKITGKAKPNTTVVIYIYSDPLVITTTSDKDGNWQYTLEDPLEPGKHEIYAIVDKGDGTYKRSDPLSFLITTVGATAGNPNGLSLKLNGTPTASQSNQNLIYYIAGTAAALVVALISLLIALRIHLKHKMKPIPVNEVGGLGSINTYENPVANIDENDGPVSTFEMPADIGDTPAAETETQTDISPDAPSDENKTETNANSEENNDTNQQW